MHLLTDPLEAPKATAMLCCDQPCCLSSQARKRRHSFQACGDGVVVSMPLFYAEKSFLHCAAVCRIVRPLCLRCPKTKQADVDENPARVVVHVGLLFPEPPAFAKMPFVSPSVR